jgi:hypothetical protein
VGTGTLSVQVDDVIEVPQHMMCNGLGELKQKVHADFENSMADVKYLF